MRTGTRVRQTPIVWLVHRLFGRGGRTYDGAEMGDDRQKEPEIQRCGPTMVHADAFHASVT